MNKKEAWSYLLGSIDDIINSFGKHKKEAAIPLAMLKCICTDLSKKKNFCNATIFNIEKLINHAYEAGKIKGMLDAREDKPND
jgi:hypothetical protein